jgi:diketogulonate reductase-like aldo/keto reductase
MSGLQTDVNQNFPAARTPVHFYDGAEMPQLGFGVWQADADVTTKSVVNAIHAGFRLIDTATVYGNEQQVGEGIRKCIDQRIVSREELFITTKLWNIHHDPRDVRSALQASLGRLGLDYVDLYLMHFPVGFKNEQRDFDDLDEETLFPKSDKGGCKAYNVPVIETWSAMEKLVDEGLARHIGVCNFSAIEMDRLLHQCRIKPVLNQVELHPCLPQDELSIAHAKHRIVTQAFSPLGIGMGDAEQSLLKHPIVAEIAERFKMQPAELLLRWNLSKGHAVLTKSESPEHIRESAILSSEMLPVEAINALDEFGAKNPLRTLDLPFLEGGKKKFDDGKPDHFEAGQRQRDTVQSRG